MILHVLVHIKRVEFLAVKARKEHAHHKKQVERFHRRILLLHAPVDIIVVGTEILGRECRAIPGVVVVHDGLQLVPLRGAVSKARIHSGVIIILVGVLGIGEHRADRNLRVKGLENLVVLDELRHRLNGEYRIKLTVDC